MNCLRNLLFETTFHRKEVIQVKLSITTLAKLDRDSQITADALAEIESKVKHVTPSMIDTKWKSKMEREIFNATKAASAMKTFFRNLANELIDMKLK